MRRRAYVSRQSRFFQRTCQLDKGYTSVQGQDAYSHLVLSERSSFVAANDSGAPQSLDSLEMLDEAVLARHFVGCQSEADSHGGHQSLGDIGDYYTDEEPYRVHPAVAYSLGQREEQHSQENGPARYQFHKPVDLS